MSPSNGIGELSESTLHNSLKHYYHKEGDEIEVSLNGYVIDVKRDDELIEIQTSSFSSVKKKYRKLLKNYTIRMVYPIAIKKIIVKEHKDGRIERRKSPKKGKIYDLFRELVSIPKMILHPNFNLDVVFIQEEEWRKNDGKGSWRRKGWSITDHKLVSVEKVIEFSTVKDFVKLLPKDLPKEFTTGDLSKFGKMPKYMAQKMVYSLNKMDGITKIGKSGRYNLYVLN